MLTKSFQLNKYYELYSAQAQRRVQKNQFPCYIKNWNSFAGLCAVIQLNLLNVQFDIFDAVIGECYTVSVPSS